MVAAVSTGRITTAQGEPSGRREYGSGRSSALAVSWEYGRMAGHDVRGEGYGYGGASRERGNRAEGAGGEKVRGRNKSGKFERKNHNESREIRFCRCGSLVNRIVTSILTG